MEFERRCKNKIIKNPNCTGIIQPPIHSTVCMKIFEITKDKKTGINF